MNSASKIPHPDNFEFATKRVRSSLYAGDQKLGVGLTALAADVWRLELQHSRWGRSLSQAALSPERIVGSAAGVQCCINDEARLSIESASGQTLLQGSKRGTFGISGDSWLIAFESNAAQRFYGLGEKWGGFEKSGAFTRFWNTDAWADFHRAEIVAASADPLYATVPYLIVKCARHYVGILVDNPFPVFVSTGAHFEFHHPKVPPEKHLFLGATGGKPVVYFLVAPDLASLTRKLQQLVGTTPRPPLWALGHHQSRWGYESYADLAELDRCFSEHDIPCDGLWLDIDYMADFKVFTFDRGAFSRPKQQLQKLRAKGRRVVAILDPGIKCEPGYAPFDEGLAAGHFCLAPSGKPYTGIVWPGASHFPDFSLPEVRAWWAGHVTRMANDGLSGFWLDMNDPSTGRVELDSMRFSRGKGSHDTYHNQYALGMAMASHEGLRHARPDERPFLLSRSAFTSMARYSAVWTGDNFSNERHLRTAIATTLNLALSGIPFNGPDVPGFGGDADDDLAVRWYKLGFLFPFFRNHACQGTRLQEPWAFSPKSLRIIRHFIQLRYKLLPYLYNLFIQQEATGEAILRPLLYDFERESKLGLDRLDDQFMVGPALMQAPCLTRTESERRVVLPAGYWFDAAKGAWISGQTSVSVADEPLTTPLFVRDRQIVPMLQGTPKTNQSDLSRIDLHCFLHGDGRAAFEYEFDDGLSYDYVENKRTRLTGHCTREGRRLCLHVTSVQSGYERCRMRVVGYGGETELVVSGLAMSRTLPLRAHTWNMVGTRLECRISPELLI